MKVVKKTFGKIIQCISKETDNSYMDWRAKFIGVPGLVLVLESEKKYPGKAFVYFYPYEDGWDPTYSFHSSYGDLELSEDGCELSTDNSVYEFEFDDKELPESAKQEYFEIAEQMKNSTDEKTDEEMLKKKG